MKKILLGTTAIVAAGMIAAAPSAIAAEKNQAQCWWLHGAVVRLHERR
jgi:hypothetical protein